MKIVLLKMAYCAIALLSLCAVQTHICRATVPLPILLVAGAVEICHYYDPLMLLSVLSALALVLFVFIRNFKVEFVSLTVAVVSLWTLVLFLGENEGALIRMLPFGLCTVSAPFLLLKLSAKIKSTNQHNNQCSITEER